MGKIMFNGVDYSAPTTGATGGVGTSTTPGLTKLYTGIGSNTDGAMTQSAVTSALNNRVSAVKGNAETSYRTGNVNITPANIGLGNVNNTADSAKSVKYATSSGTADTLNADMADLEDIKTTFTEATTRTNIASEETCGTIFGKIKKWFTDLKTVAFTGSYNDLSNKPTIPSVGNGTITITQAGVTKGSFTTNQTGNTTIALTDNNTTYSTATQSANGLMSASDKSKLDGIATGANAYTLPSATSSTLGGVKTTDSSAVTDSTGLALAATEKNASISGTLANQISTLNNNLDIIGKWWLNNNVGGSSVGFVEGKFTTISVSYSNMPHGNYLIIITGVHECGVVGINDTQLSINGEVCRRWYNGSSFVPTSLVMYATLPQNPKITLHLKATNTGTAYSEWTFIVIRIQ